MPSPATRRRIAYWVTLGALGVTMPAAAAAAQIRRAAARLRRQMYPTRLRRLLYPAPWEIAGRLQRTGPGLPVDGVPLEGWEDRQLQRLAADLAAVPDDPGPQP